MVTEVKRFVTEGGAVLTPENIKGQWRIVISAEGVRRVGKTIYESKEAAIKDLEANSTRRG